MNHYKIVNRSTRQTLITGLSQFEANQHLTTLTTSFPGVKFTVGKDLTR